MEIFLDDQEIAKREYLACCFTCTINSALSKIDDLRGFFTAKPCNTCPQLAFGSRIPSCPLILEWHFRYANIIMYYIPATTFSYFI